MQYRLGSAAVWLAGGFLLGAAALAGGQGDEDLREKLIELEELSAQLRALDAAETQGPVVSETGCELDYIPLTDVVACVWDFLGPSYTREEGPIFGCMAEEPLQPFGTIEEVSELVRVQVRPEAWESGAAGIDCFEQGLLLSARPDVSRAVRTFVDKELRPAARGTVNLQIEILEAEAPLADALAAATGGEIDAALRGLIEEAVGAGKARRTFDGRVLGLSGQQIVFWHGAQAAMVSDVDVDVATRSESPDPVVSVELLGTIVEARSTIGADGRLRVAISLDENVPDPTTRRVETAKAGVLQMPARSTMSVKADLWTADDKWAVAGERTAVDGKRRFLLVRPSVIGGAR